MRLYLTIDQGNSSTKLAIWDGTRLIEEEAVHELTRQHLAKSVDRFHPERALCCSVTGNGKRIAQWLQSQGVDAREINLNMPLPIKVDYAANLGVDRLAAAVGAWSLFPGTDLLVVDMGTAVTYDFVSADGHFRGGNIAPGIGMRLRSLNSFTARLPQIGGYGETPLLGTDTGTAMRAGAVRGVVAELTYYRSKLPPTTRVVLTGGWSAHVSEFLDFDNVIDRNLVTKGLLTLLMLGETNNITNAK